MSISVGGWFFITFLLITIVSFLSSCFMKSEIEKENWCIGTAIFSIPICIMIAVIVCINTYDIHNSEFKDFHFMNETENPVKITCIKSRPFVDDYVDSIIVYPNQAIIIKNTKILNQKAIEF